MVSSRGAGSSSRSSSPCSAAGVGASSCSVRKDREEPVERRHASRVSGRVAAPDQKRGFHAHRGGPFIVRDEIVADVQRFTGRRSHQTEGGLEDRRGGLLRADLARDDDLLELLGEAKLAEKRPEAG